MARIEHDLLGELAVPDEALYGIHTLRALENFPPTRRQMPKPLIVAFARVKQAAAMTNRELGVLSEEQARALIAACEELAAGRHDAQIVVDPLAGGAGTSLNMNVNEVLANRGLELLGLARGDYPHLHPNDHVNCHQSTNDVFPTALRVAALWELLALEEELVALQAAWQEKEREFAEVAMVARTELQDALPMTAGQLFSSYAEAIARDRWRVFKAVERLKVVNLGGTAIGTGLGAPRAYIFKAVEKLRELTGLPLARAENLLEATSNQDALLEADAILGALAANLYKAANDLRLLSWPAVAELGLPARQAGSSIMPGKVNPVIAEYVQQLSLEVLAGHQALAQAIANGNLQLSQFFPLAAWHMLDNLHLMRQAVASFTRNAVHGIAVRRENAQLHLSASLAVAAALLPKIGYERAQEAVKLAQSSGLTLKEALIRLGVDGALIDETLAPSRLRRLGD